MSTDLDLEQRYATATLEVLGTFRMAADALASDFNLDNATAVYKLAARIQDALGGPRATRGEVDGRTSKWRCRFRIYDGRNISDPIADSDDGLSVELPGTTVVSGLAAVAVEVAELAKAFHAGRVLVGLNHEELMHKLKSIRPTLSRNDGEAKWRIHYETIEPAGNSILARAGAAQNVKREWLMRVDIIKEETRK